MAEVELTSGDAVIVDEQDAADAYEKAAVALHGEYARVRTTTI